MTAQKHVATTKMNAGLTMMFSLMFMNDSLQ